MRYLIFASKISKNLTFKKVIQAPQAGSNFLGMNLPERDEVFLPLVSSVNHKPTIAYSANSKRFAKIVPSMQGRV